MALLIRCFCLWVVLASPLGAEEVARFLRVEIPVNEARLSALAGVEEYRCSYRLPRVVRGSLLVAEWYRNGRLIGRYRLSRAKYDPSREVLEGTISLGWEKRQRRLVSVQVNGDYGGLWSASVLLSGFEPAGAFYFQQSLPEEREGGKVTLFPVMGLVAAGPSQMRFPQEGATTSDFLESCKAANRRDAVVLYLYESLYEEEPLLKFFAAEEG